MQRLARNARRGLPRIPVIYRARLRDFGSTQSLAARKTPALPPRGERGRPASRAQQVLPREAAASASGASASGQGGSAGGPDDDEELKSIAAEGDAPLRIKEQEGLIEQLLSVQDAEFRAVDVSSLETDDYAPVAPRTRWLRLRGVRGVELAVPRRWKAWVGEGICLSIPFRTYHFAMSPPGALTTVALSVTFYRGAYNAPALRSTPHTGVLGATQFLAQLHQVGGWA